MPTCKGCGASKPLDAFYLNSGRPMGKCKECTKAAVRANQRANAEHYREYDRARGMRADRVAARKAYRKTPGGRAAVARAHQGYHERHAQRREANIAVGNAVRDGKLAKWPCQVVECGRPDVEAHHPDYANPMAVVWLCNEHHRQIHDEHPREDFDHGNAP